MRLVSSTHTLEITEEERHSLLAQAGSLRPDLYPALAALYRALDVPENE